MLGSQDTCTVILNLGLLQNEDDIIKEIEIPDLQPEQPSERVVLDIQDSKRYFESQSKDRGHLNITEEVRIELAAIKLIR